MQMDKKRKYFGTDGIRGRVGAGERGAGRADMERPKAGP